MNFYKRYLGDYARDTGHLSPLEHGMYNLLLDHFYATEKPLPSDRVPLYRIARARTPSERTAVESIVDQFWKLDGSGLVNSRAQVEMKNAIELRTRSRVNGSRPKRAKSFVSNKPSKPAGKPVGSQQVSQKGSTRARTRHQTPEPEQSPDLQGRGVAEVAPSKASPSPAPSGAAREPTGVQPINGVEHADTEPSDDRRAIAKVIFDMADMDVDVAAENAAAIEAAERTIEQNIEVPDPEPEPVSYDGRPSADFNEGGDP